MDYPSPYDSSLPADAAFPIGMLVFLGIVTLISYVLYAALLGMIFKKAGVKVWKAWVPVYNQWIFLELGGQKGWLSLLGLGGILVVPVIVLYVYMAIAANRIALSFGKDEHFVLLYIFLPLVWLIWLAVDSTATWRAKPATASSGPATSL